MNLNVILPEYLSVLVKYIVFIILLLLTLELYKKYQLKQKKLVRNIFISMLLYTIVPVISSFNILLGWRNFPYENAYFGMMLVYILNGIANSFFFWTIIEIIYDQHVNEKRIKALFLIHLVAGLSVNIIALILKLLESPYWIIFSLIHLFIALITYFLVFYLSVKSINFVKDNKPFFNRLRYLILSSLFSMIGIIFVGIDSFYVDYNVFNLMVWVCYLISFIYLYKAFIDKKK